MTIDQQLQTAKRNSYERITIDAESFQRRVLEKARSSSGKSVRSIDKPRKYAWFAIPAAVVLLSGFSYAAFVKGTMLRQTPTIATAISEAPFPIALPKYMPVHYTNEWGQVSYYGSNSPSNTDVSIVWEGVLSNGKRASVTEDVALTSAKVNRLPKHQRMVQLSNGEAAIFAVRSGSLFWKSGNETYRLTLHPWNVMSVSELIRIADSVK